jgi:hypothetical protein
LNLIHIPARFGRGWPGATPFLLLTRFVPGQLQTDYQESTVYRREGPSWRPIVLARTLGRPSPSPLAIPHAELVGWLSDTELLVAQGGRLVVYSDGGVRRRETPIAAARASRAFLR